MRHRPHEPALREVLPWLAAENSTLFNAYQQTQGKQAQQALARAKDLTSFVGQDSGAVLFVDL